MVTNRNGEITFPYTVGVVSSVMLHSWLQSTFTRPKLILI